MLEPTTFPMARSTFLFLTAMIEVASSGREVPSETMVNAMILSGTIKDSAKSTTPLTIKRPPAINSTRPKTINKTERPVENSLVLAYSCKDSVLRR